MNTRTRRMFQDALIAIVLSVILGLVEKNTMGIPLGFILLPMTWLSLRHGGPLSILTAAVVGVVIGVIQRQGTPIGELLLTSLAPLLGVGLGGLFARNTQRTLNNLRYSSTYLNIFTASLLILGIYYGVRYGLLPQLGLTPPLSWQSVSLGLMITWLISAGSLSLLAKNKPQAVIPRRSKYLPRRETSSLLND